MKLANMQAYLFSYLGYFQIMAAVDKFVIYDDVAFIKQGWVNRNQVLLHARPCLLSQKLSEGGVSGKSSVSSMKLTPSAKAVDFLTATFRKLCVHGPGNGCRTARLGLAGRKS